MSLFRRRHLPHFDVENKAYFITACLHGSINAASLKKIRDYRNELTARPKPQDLSNAEWELNKDKLVFKLIDRVLDNESPVNHLKNETLAKIVVDAFLHFADERYRLLAFVVMPSHHHWLFFPEPHWCDQLATDERHYEKPRTPREVISHSVQSVTAHRCNRILGQTGPFWQSETYDHFARDEAETMRIIQYIENNPVSAGFCQQPEHHPWSSASFRQRHNIPVGDPLK